MRKPGRYYNQFKIKIKNAHIFIWNKRSELQVNTKLVFPQREEKEKVNANSIGKTVCLLVT